MLCYLFLTPLVERANLRNIKIYFAQKNPILEAARSLFKQNLECGVLNGQQNFMCQLCEPLGH